MLLNSYELIKISSCWIFKNLMKITLMLLIWEFFYNCMLLNIYKLMEIANCWIFENFDNHMMLLVWGFFLWLHVVEYLQVDEFQVVNIWEFDKNHIDVSLRIFYTCMLLNIYELMKIESCWILKNLMKLIWYCSLRNFNNCILLIAFLLLITTCLWLLEYYWYLYMDVYL